MDNKFVILTVLSSGNPVPRLFNMSHIVTAIRALDSKHSILYYNIGNTFEALEVNLKLEDLMIKLNDPNGDY